MRGVVLSTRGAQGSGEVNTWEVLRMTGLARPESGIAEHSLQDLPLGLSPVPRRQGCAVPLEKMAPSRCPANSSGSGCN